MHALQLHLAVLAAAVTGSIRRLHDDEDGLTTTEIAVITFLLVGAAIVVMGIIYAAAQSNANNIPVPTAPA
jgi:Flp pilus assembly pilin Flp